jgi:hypothetical protein
MFRKHKLIKDVKSYSEPYDPKMFGNHNQTVNVNVNIEEKDDGMAECISGCFKACFGLAKTAAK